MPKEKGYNPVQAQRKAEKAKAIKKGKAEAQDRRNERLARKNPDRIQKQIDDLKAIAAGGGKLSRHEEQLLEGLEKEFKGIKKARDTLGDRAPSFSRGGRQGGDSGVLGKRRRNSAGSSTDEDVPDEVRKIPMPRDTPPPISKEILDQWYARRRARRNPNADAMREDAARKEQAAKTEAPPIEVQTVYEAKPIMRDLRQEAVSAFVPAAVQRKLNKGRGQGGLIEPEEADRLEKEGYLKSTNEEGEAAGNSSPHKSLTVTVEDSKDDDD
ncbi:WW domain binding protein 11 [Metarhizium rileyi]|uniref:WW domain binding protein 11 n=1 Tax=Metarhizium rileyi (strain RCEF 4871) TaxID=1649241 RepID=A0A167FC82_METRR|nr:WW domain binding protein 11 [Metarhizium rileyi RCEF 4871]